MPRVRGQCAVRLEVIGKGGVWEIAWRQTGSGLAEEGDARRIAATLLDLSGRSGLRVALQPSIVLGGTLLDSGDLEHVPASEGAEFTLRGRAAELNIDAAQALEAARDLSERSVIELNSGLAEVCQLSKQQCTDVQGITRTFDATGGLGGALTALEGEVSSVSERLQGVLAGHLIEVGGATASAQDIVKLASAVEQIAQSARMLTFNAKVESARLGSEGKGFVVIAGAISDLAKDVRTSNDLVTGLAEELATKLPRLCQDTAQLAKETEAQLAGLRHRLGSLRETFQSAREQAVAELVKAEAAAQAVKARSHDVIRHLQFQDRTSQLLMRAKGHVEAMEAALGVEEAVSDDLVSRAGERGQKVDGKTVSVEPGDVTLF